MRVREIPLSDCRSNMLSISGAPLSPYVCCHHTIPSLLIPLESPFWRHIPVIIAYLLTISCICGYLAPGCPTIKHPNLPTKMSRRNWSTRQRIIEHSHALEKLHCRLPSLDYMSNVVLANTPLPLPSRAPSFRVLRGILLGTRNAGHGPQQAPTCQRQPLFALTGVETGTLQMDTRMLGIMPRGIFVEGKLG